MEPTKRVSVYCSSSKWIDDAYFKEAKALGALMAQSRIGLVYGGGREGLMGAVCDGVKEQGGWAAGVIPRFMVEKGWLRQGLDEVVEVETMSQRKQAMADMSQGVIILPGGIGTLDEMMDILSLKHLGLYPHPVVLLNTGRFYDSLVELFKVYTQKRFLSQSFGQLWQVADAPEAAIQAVFPQ